MIICQKKTIKKSDLEKEWMKKRRDDRRMIAPEYHLIVTEGTQTEPKYFTQLKDEINKNTKTVFLFRLKALEKVPTRCLYLIRLRKLF